MCVSTQKCLTEEYSVQLLFLLPSQLLAKYAKNQQQLVQKFDNGVFFFFFFFLSSPEQSSGWAIVITLCPLSAIVRHQQLVC